MADPEDPTPDAPGAEPAAELDTDESGEPERDDDPEERDAAFAERLGLPPGDFPGRFDAAVQHASQPGRDAGAAAWTPLGPRNVGGRIRALVQDPNDPRTFYAGSDMGGLWTTLDEGLSWRPGRQT